MTTFIPNNLQWEVGQRRTFLSDYIYPETPSIIGKDEIIPTEARQRLQLDSFQHGDFNLPSWSIGSSKQIEIDSKGLLYALHDLLTIENLSLPLIQTALGAGFGLSSSIGYTSRKAFFLPVSSEYFKNDSLNYIPGDTITTEAFSNSPSVKIRAAASYWDFSTSFDPCYIPIEENSGILIRNLDSLSFLSLDIAPSTGFIHTFSNLLPASGFSDESVAFVWSGDPSVSDTTYTPPVLAQKGQQIGIDLSSGFLTSGSGASASFLNPQIGLVFVAKPNPGVLVPGSDLTPLA